MSQRRTNIHVEETHIVRREYDEPDEGGPSLGTAVAVAGGLGLLALLAAGCVTYAKYEKQARREAIHEILYRHKRSDDDSSD
jgi:hypothetical protein